MPSKSRELSPKELEGFAAELEALRARTVADIGEQDAKYIRRVYSAVRYFEVAGRGLLFLGIFPPAFILGTLFLAISKILDNMELGHNVMHGQYDWMRDPKFNGKSFEWDIVATGDNWRKTHNYRHHTYTNIKGMDEDIGYGILRLFPEQRWRPGYLWQPIYSIVFELIFFSFFKSSTKKSFSLALFCFFKRQTGVVFFLNNPSRLLSSEAKKRQKRSKKLLR